MSSIQDRLNAMNPAGYPKQPELSAAAIKQNKKWVAEKRAENAAKEAEKSKKAPKKATPKAVGPSRPSFSPAGPPKATKVGEVEQSRRMGGPIVGDPFTRAGMEKIRSGEHVDPRTSAGMQLVRAQKEAVLAEGPDVPITDPVSYSAEANRLAALAPKSVSSKTDGFGNFPLPSARPTSAGPGLATRGYREILKHHAMRVGAEHPEVVNKESNTVPSRLADIRYLGGPEAVTGALKDVQSMRVAETVGITKGTKGNKPTGASEAAKSASSQMTPQGMVRHEVHGEVPRPGQMSTWREAEFEGGPPASAAAASAVVSEAQSNLLGSLRDNRPGERGGGRQSVDDLIAGGAAPEEEGKQYEPKFDNKGKLLNPRPFDYSGKRGKVGRGGEARAETVGGQRVRATGQRESTAVVGGETVEIPSKLRYENVGGGRRGRPDEAGTVGTTVETRQMTNAERNAMQTSGLKPDRISEIFQALGEQVPEAMRPKPATSGVSKGKKEFAARAEADTRRKKIEESAKKKAAAKKKK
jgi:hypothetical protein